MYKTRKQTVVFTSGFALPTVVVASVVLLMVLVTAVSTTVAVGNGIREQNYLRHAGLAAEAGKALATACLGVSNGTITWSNEKPLRPNTDCSGTVISGKSAYVASVSGEGFRTYFVVDGALEAKGYVEALRTSNGLAWRIWSNTASAAQAPGGVVPVGTYIEGAWTTAPDGYLLADGAAVSRTTYANLFAVIGTNYGTGNGSTTFNLPDTRGRVSVNQSSDTEFDTMGEKYGEKAHTLTIAEMPSHTHTASTANGFSGQGRFVLNVYDHAASGNRAGGAFTGTGGLYNDWASLNQTGGGAAHNNIQPSIVVKRAIKY